MGAPMNPTKKGLFQVKFIDLHLPRAVCENVFCSHVSVLIYYLTSILTFASFLSNPFS